MKVDGGVAVITGGASGIGRQLALQLAGKSCTVIIADKDVEGMKETWRQVTESGGHCFYYDVDVSDRTRMHDFAREVLSEHGEVSILINNAGVSLVEEAAHIEYDDFDWLMKINFWGVVHGCKEFLPVMSKSGSHIVNVSSVFGLISMPMQSAYNASKFAVRGYTEALRIELADSKTGVTCVHPGGIKTSIAVNSRLGSSVRELDREEMAAWFDEQAYTSADKAAAKIIRAIERRKVRITIGPDAKLIDWISRLFPSIYEKILRLQSRISQVT